MNLVLLHGFCENKSMWDDFIPYLGSSINVIALDLPGFGDNFLNIENISIKEMAENVYYQIENHYTDEYFILGHSLGGYVALEFAKQFPNKLKGIILFHSTPFEDGEVKKINRTKTIEFFKKYGIAKFAESFISALFLEENRKELKNEILKVTTMVKATSLKTAIEVTKAMRDRNDFSNALHSFDVPILAILGKNDSFIDFERNIRLFDECKSVDTLVLEKTAHMGMFEEREKSAKTVIKFILKHRK